MEDLRSPKIETRRAALDAIHAMGPTAVPYLTNAFAQKDTLAMRLRRGGFIPKKLIRAASRVVDWQSPISESQRAALALQSLGTNAVEAIPQLIAALNDPQVSNFAADALAGIGAPAVPALRQMLLDNTNVSWTLYALGRIGTNAIVTVPEIIPHLISRNTEVSYRALLALMRMSPASIPEVTNHLSDTNALMRANLLNVIHQIGPPAMAARPAVLPLVRDPSSDVRNAALMAYASLYPLPAEAAPVWLEALKDSSSTNVAFALQMLIAFPRNVHNHSNELAALAERPERFIREPASNALTRFNSWPPALKPAIP